MAVSPDEFKIGDVAWKSDDGSGNLYGFVQKIEGGYVWANWHDDYFTALNFAKGISSGWGCYAYYQVEFYERPVSNSSTSRCSCPWSMFVRGCECGAIKKYKGGIGV